MGFELVQKQVLYNGKKIRLELHHLRDSDTDKRHTREVVVHPGAVLVLPFVDPYTILLVRNRRWAVGKSLLELPAGTLEPGEPPMDCAGRELLEETGYLAGRMRPIGTFYTSPGILSELMYAFVAEDLEPQQTALEEGEEIELVPTGWNEAMDLIECGEIQDGKTIAALLRYDRFYKR